MTRFSLAIVATILSCGCGLAAQTSDTKGQEGKVCRMEQQCHWENFKKICTWVKVCR
jgi:hypothetical protein